MRLFSEGFGKTKFNQHPKHLRLSEIREKVNLYLNSQKSIKDVRKDSCYREMVIRPNFKVIYNIDDSDDVEVMAVVHSPHAWENLEEE